MRSIIFFFMTALLEAAVPALPALNIDWQSYTPKYCDLPSNGSVRAENAFIEVPADYWAENADPNLKIKLRVRRFVRGDAQCKKSVWIVPGGPGGHSNSIEIGFDRYHEMVPSEVCILVMDHRGTGKSSKMLRSKDMEQYTKGLEPIVKNLLYPIQVISVHNAAMDLVALSNAIKTGSADRQVYLYGESYGAFLSSYAVRLRPDIFSGVILDGFAPGLHMQGGREADLREPLKEICQRSPECRALINPEDIPNLAGNFVRSNNDCLKAVIERSANSKKLTKEERNQPAAVVRSLISESLDAFDLKLRIPATLAILKGGVACENLDDFKAALSFLDEKSKKSSSNVDSSTSGEILPMRPDEELGQEVKKEKSDKQFSQILHNYLRFSEKQQDSGTCAPSDDQMLSRCEAIKHDDMAEYLKPYFYRVHPVPSWPSNLPPVIVVTASADERTPLESAKDEFDRISSKDKTFYKVYYGPHVTLNPGICGLEVITQLVGGSKENAEKCIKRFNARFYPPYIEIEPKIKALWGAETLKNAKVVSLPTDDVESEYSDWLYYGGIGAGIGTALGALIGIVVYCIRKRKN